MVPSSACISKALAVLLQKSILPFPCYFYEHCIVATGFIVSHIQHIHVSSFFITIPQFSLNYGGEGKLQIAFQIRKSTHSYFFFFTVSVNDNFIFNTVYRTLFLAWLLVREEKYDALEDGVYTYDDDDKGESGFYLPPILPNLKKRSASLQAFVNYFGVNQDCVTAAASKSVVVKQPATDYQS